MSVPALYGDLVEDAVLLDESVPPADAVAAHRALIGSGRGAAVGALLVTDRQVAEVARIVTTDEPVRTVLINTSGAGGLVALAQRDHPSLDVVGVVSTLRDLDDLSGNARRVVAAADTLDPTIAVHVGLPRAAGWERAAEEVEAAGLHAAVDFGPGSGPDSLESVATQLRDLIELDLPFRAAGIASDGIGLPALLVAVEALVEDSGVDRAAQLLTAADDSAAEMISDWDDATAQRVRRRVRSVTGGPAARVLDALTTAGLLSGD